MRLKFSDKLLYNIYVRLRAREFLDSAGLIEGEVEEVGIGVVIEAEGADGSAGLAATDGAFDIEKLPWFGLARLLAVD